MRFAFLLLFATLLIKAQIPGSFTQIDIDCGGWFTGIQQHQSGRLYGRTDVGGVYRSNDLGNSWTFWRATSPPRADFVSRESPSRTIIRIPFTKPAGSPTLPTIQTGGSGKAKMPAKPGKRSKQTSISPETTRPVTEENASLFTRRLMKKSGAARTETASGNQSMPSTVVSPSSENSRVTILKNSTTPATTENPGVR